MYNPDLDEKPNQNNWWNWSECSVRTKMNPDMVNAWIREDNYYSETTRRICLTDCPVRDFCVRDAILDPEAEGMRGGFYFDEGALLKNDAKQLLQEYGVVVPTRRLYRPHEKSYDELDALEAESAKLDSEGDE